ncbi:unnamed protein product [Prorocentrum cordatum]|uniref:Coatomer subunit delta n=1 Tax=Prorocentrum cordatum TaxID=2364126 RepID=A0ABN9Y6N9_9DINO|nr:unnamed protein product [Polarella glacialis]
MASMLEAQFTNPVDTIQTREPLGALLVLQRSGCLLVGHICRVALGVTPSRAQVAAQAAQQERLTADALQRSAQAAADARAAAGVSASSAREAAKKAPSEANPDNVELCSTTDQVSKVIVKKADSEITTTHYSPHVKAMGWPGARPRFGVF